MRRTMTMLAVIAAVVLGGCSLPTEELEEWKGEAETVLTDLRTERTAWEESLEASRDEVTRGRIEDKLVALDAQITGAETTLTNIDAALDSQSNNTPIDSIVGAVLPFIPPGWREIALLGAGLGGTLVRAYKLKAGMKSVAAGIQTAREDPAFNEEFNNHKTGMNLTQTPTAIKVIAQAKGKRNEFLPI